MLPQITNFNNKNHLEAGFNSGKNPVYYGFERSPIYWSSNSYKYLHHEKFSAKVTVGETEL
jgi:hypothetical protein